ncbi:MAG: tRNA (adenosine(37)-N6)-threonylcarbamoyltransferase complex ATPase subunit type 1 TsaE [Verrucomicrobium sp.]|nr:tRNA (adenosine(37)-N6)-threonylcarbamoyltransferase complex ATPase subunit type 1 TsaE [Verrucomicrobium sp.]
MDSIILPDAAAARAAGAAWAARCKGSEVFALHGPVGAGKTELARGLAAGLGFSGEVTSPTFSLLHEYLGGRFPLYHLDLYRLAHAEEVRGLGLEDYVGEGVIAIEWPALALPYLPPETEHWQMDLLPDGARRLFRL